MSKRTFLFLSFALLFGIQEASGQTSTSDNSELVKRTAQNAAWKVTFAPKIPSTTKPSPTDPPALTAVEVTKVQNMRRIISSWSNGKQSEKWWVNGVLLFQTDGSNQVSMTQQFIGWFRDDNYSGTDFPELSWINKNFYMAEGGTEKRTYLCKVPLRKAVINAKTGLPITFDDGIDIRTYYFEPVAPSALKLPPNFNEVYELYKKASY